MYYTNEKIQDKFRKEFKEKIFLAMQLSKQSYIDILKMPIHTIAEYISWKNKLDEEINKELQTEYNKK